ncbi:unnamed protein product [Phytophthora fragariaefolia]|uniref:Unnamed protein product n=1 Tax=Phytophthora fragariaefolia TaxID=1490495 RepID=A0A9W6WJI2_9STRA|nr:unnamed protein product [Phytophthora fragariaefolia]
MEQLDADTASRYSELKCRSYMEVPFGIENANDYECQLNEVIYGLKQAASAWNKTIHCVFLENGFKSCGADQRVYVKRSENGLICTSLNCHVNVQTRLDYFHLALKKLQLELEMVYVCFYVDVMIFKAKTREEVRGVKDALKNTFKMKELGPAKFILGMEIDPDMTAGTLIIKQIRYIDDVVGRFGQDKAKPVDNPCIAELKLSMTQSPGTDAERNEMRSRPYRSLVGCLLYITTVTGPPFLHLSPDTLAYIT